MSSCTVGTALCFFSFFFVDWLDSSFSLSCLDCLTHYRRISISLSHTSHFSSINCIHFLTSSQLYFHSCAFISFQDSLNFPFSPLCLPLASLSSFTLSLFSPSPSLRFFFCQRVLHTFFFFFSFFTDASLSGGVCSEYLKPRLPLPLWPTCPSCSTWRSQTLEPQFWAPLMSSACSDTTVMYPSWSKVC